MTMNALPHPEERPTVDLWPTAGEALGLGRTATFAAAKRGEFPGLIKIGNRYRVATAALRQAVGLDRPLDDDRPLSDDRWFEQTHPHRAAATARRAVAADDPPDAA